MNIQRHFVPVFAVIGLLSSGLRAQTAKLHDSLNADYQKADAELNRVYKETMGRLEPADQEELKRYQRAWLKQMEERGGVVSALISETNGRIDFLKSFSTKEGGFPPPGFHVENSEDDEVADKRGFEIKTYVGEIVSSSGRHIATQQTWVVSTKDPGEHHLLPPYRNEQGDDETAACEECAHYVSPDQKWILRWQKDTFASTAYLYRREKGVKFVRATQKGFGDMAWEFLEERHKNSKKAAGLCQDLLRTWSTEFGSWTDDSAKLRIKLSGHEKRSWMITDWTCDFNLKKGIFEEPASLKKHNEKAVTNNGE